MENYLLVNQKLEIDSFKSRVLSSVECRGLGLGMMDNIDMEHIAKYVREHYEKFKNENISLTPSFILFKIMSKKHDKILVEIAYSIIKNLYNKGEIDHLIEYSGYEYEKGFAFLSISVFYK